MNTNASKTETTNDAQRVGAQWALRDYQDACRVIADPRSSRREIDEAKAEAANADVEAARKNLRAAMVALARATTKRAKRDAAEDVEFWGNRAAFLAAWIAKKG